MQTSFRKFSRALFILIILSWSVSVLATNDVPQEMQKEPFDKSQTAKPESRFLDNQDGTITDLQQKL